MALKNMPHLTIFSWEGQAEEVSNGIHNSAYSAEIAQGRAEKRKENSHKHAKWRDTKLEHFICRRIKEHHSPEVISAKIPEYFEGKTLSHTSIYTMIRKHRPEWAQYLPHHGRRKKLTHAASKDKIPDRIDISERPADINDRSVFGHYEADTVLSCREGKSCLVVLVERKTRKYLIVIALRAAFSPARPVFACILSSSIKFMKRP